MDAFGKENLEEAVDAALEEQNRETSFSVDQGCLTVDVSDLEDEAYLDVFETLFSPVDGYLDDLPPDTGFRLRERNKTVIGWGTENIEVYTSEVTGEEIREMQEMAVDQSFAEGYSPMKFRELYEEMR